MRGIAIFVILSSLLFSKYWDSQFDITLKKDEVSTFQIFDTVRIKNLTFRWTLYINKGLVVLANFDKYPYQFMLYKDYNRDSFRLKLQKKRSFVMIEFYNFDFQKQEAKFKVLFKNIQADIFQPSDF